jgi:hypothetical protein
MDIVEVIDCICLRETKKAILDVIKKNNYNYRTDVKVDIENTSFELFVEVKNCMYNNYEVLADIVIKIVYKGLVIHKSVELYNYKINILNLESDITKYDTIILDAINKIIEQIYITLHYPTIKCSKCDNYIFNTLNLTVVECY